MLRLNGFFHWGGWFCRGLPFFCDRIGCPDVFGGLIFSGRCWILGDFCRWLWGTLCVVSNCRIGYRAWGVWY